jgi:predicted small secreted protein
MCKKALLVLLLIMATLCFYGCQTMHGVGGDLKWTGEQIEAGAANCTVPPSEPSQTK